ncbi:MAG: peroxiredoxin, partial [Candidatus Bathyarchaeota archaeon]|nr:peroxiredoxin [Candidatus Bathyarchaeota archaeon]
MPNVKVGEPAPDFTLPDQDGEPVTISSYHGESSVVLFFYPKDFSPGCTTQACHFRDSYEDFTDLGAEVLGVSSDSVESHKRFLDEYLFPFRLLSDEGDKVRKLYGATKGFGLLPGRY